MISIDVFAGAGGASEGIRQAWGSSPSIALNHWARALATHQANHPECLHVHDDVRAVDPAALAAGRPVGLLWMSPDCRHFSRARGSRPTSESVRMLPWEMARWAQALKPGVLILENVVDITGWDQWPVLLDALRALGYRCEHRRLRACDYGVPTSRTRLFLIARRDADPICWPVPTHGPGLLPFRTAADVLDLSIPCPSIFGRARPLADATLRRIAAGCVRFAPGGGDWIAKHYGGVIGHTLHRPLGTVTAIDHHSLVHVTPGDGGEQMYRFLVQYNGTATYQAIDKPMGTITGVDRFALIAASIQDIGMRMLTPRELAKAQGFPDSYILTGNKSEQVKQVGNSVCPPIAAAIIRANLPGGIAEPVQTTLTMEAKP